MGSHEVLSKLSVFSTVIDKQFTTIQQIKDIALSLNHLLPGIDRQLGGINTTVQRIEHLAEINRDLPTSEGIVTHGVSLDTFRAIFESHMLGSRAYVLEETGKAKYTTAALEVEKHTDSTYTPHNTWAKISKKIGSLEELEKESGLDNKRWADEYYQLCFSVNTTYHKMNGTGIYFAFNRGRMLTKYQFADDDGLHMFDPEYSSKNKQPFTLDLTDEPYQIFVPKEEGLAFTEMILQMPDHPFQRYGGKAKWLETHVSAGHTLSDVIDGISEKLRVVSGTEIEQQGVVVPSGVVEENLMIRHKAPLLKYKSKSGQTLN